MKWTGHRAKLVLPLASSVQQPHRAASVPRVAVVGRVHRRHPPNTLGPAISWAAATTAQPAVAAEEGRKVTHHHHPERERQIATTNARHKKEEEEEVCQTKIAQGRRAIFAIRRKPAELTCLHYMQFVRVWQGGAGTGAATLTLGLRPNCENPNFFNERKHSQPNYE